MLAEFSIADWFIFNSLIAIGAVIIDRLFGEFLNRRHPVVLIGQWITLFNHNAYRDSVLQGLWLWLSTIFLSAGSAIFIIWALSLLPLWLSLPITMLLASTLLAHRMLFDSVQAVAQADNPQQAVKYLVSRDSQQMTANDAYKAAVETYAENLSDAVIAPWLYLLIFGLPGLLVYKAINTLDSMVGYRTEKYEKYGKVSAKLDDVANWIPARLTAVMIMLVFKQWRFWQFYQNGRLHPSPNAGHPITAMALACHCRLGGPTIYFGELKQKAYFGRPQDKSEITTLNITCALSKRNQIDTLLLAISVLIAILLS